mgnify:CR=1
MTSTLGDRLREARTGLSLSQQQIADHVGTTQSAVSAWERDETSPSTGDLVKVADILGIPVAEAVTLAADYEQRLAEGRTNRRHDPRTNHAKRPQIT